MTEQPLRPETETINISTENVSIDTGFQLPADDVRSVENRGGLEAVIERSTEPLSYEPSAQDLGPAADGTVGVSAVDPDYAGAGAAGANTTTTGSGISQLNTTTFGSSAEPPGVGPTESVIGTQVPVMGSGNDDIQTNGARVEGADGQPL